MRISLQTSLVQVIGVCVCGFALKRVNNELIYATSILLYSLLNFLLGLMIYSNPIVSTKLILLYKKSSSLMGTCLFAPLINVQLLSTYYHNEENDGGSADFWHLRTVLIVTTLSLAFFIVIEKYWQLFLDVFTVTQCALLMYLSMKLDAENFWLQSMSVLMMLNYFAVPELTRRYCVPNQELMSISYIFQNIFLVKSMR